MKIGVLSDTHIPIAASNLPSEAYKYFQDCDMIIHAGDSVTIDVLEELGMIAETKAVKGNMDEVELQKRLPEKLVFEIEGIKIGVTHGRGPASHTIDSVRKIFGKERLDIVIFGHSHQPFNRTMGGTLFFNPGSFTDLTFAPYRSYGILSIINRTIKAEIIRI